MPISGAEYGIKDARVGDQGPERKLRFICLVARVSVKEARRSGVMSRSPLEGVEEERA